MARFGTYHRCYPEMRILLLMPVLLRTAKRGTLAQGRDIQAAVLVGATLLVQLAPGGLYLLSSP